MKMKKRKGILILAAAMAVCGIFAACSGGEGAEPGTAEGDMPQLSVDISDSAQTAPENSAPEKNPEAPESSSAEETAETSSEAAADTAETEGSASERSETAIIEETSASANEQPAASDNEQNQQNGQNEIVRLALAQEGKPFYFGGADPETGFDNSGLIHYVLNQNGISCPRLTFEIAEMGTKIGYDELQAGDIAFFEYEGSGRADFGGIYIGDGMMVVSTDEDRPVSKVDITTDYYKRTFIHGVKIV